MSSRINDRWLWLGFGVVLFFAARGIRYAITDIIRDMKRLSPPRKQIKKEEELPEDNIPLHVLKTLTESPDYNISNAAINIVISRFQRLPNAYRSVIKDTESENETTRKRAQQALRFLRNWPPMSPQIEPRDDFPSRPRSRASSLSTTFNENMLNVPGLDANGFPEASGEPLSGGAGIVPSVEDPVAGWTSVPRERPTTGSDEAERRRNRREAMVFREGEGGVEEDDIIRPVLGD